MKKKPVKKSGPSTGGKVTSRIKDTDKKVPVTSVTPRVTTSKPSAAQVAGTRKVVGAIASATVGGKAVKATQKAVNLAKIKNLENKLSTLRKASNGGKNFTPAQRSEYMSLMKKYTNLQMK